MSEHTFSAQSVRSMGFKNLPTCFNLLLGDGMLSQEGPFRARVTETLRSADQAIRFDEYFEM